MPCGVLEEVEGLEDQRGWGKECITVRWVFRVGFGAPYSMGFGSGAVSAKVNECVDFEKMVYI